jgi:predicted phage baseplate assembly protein
VLVELYRVVPGARANVGPHEVDIVEGVGGVEVANLMPATGGRDAESIEQIVRRAPSILTSRDRAVTRTDFELIAKEASAEVARAACNGRMDGDGHVEIVILAHRREGDRIPDPFLSSGLRDHVYRHLKQRCLVNVQPVVRLAQFMEIDISIDLRLRPNSNVLQVRELARKWIEAFLDPYSGGLDGDGWPFNGTLYAQDFARMVSQIPEVRHVGMVHLYDMSQVAPGTTTPGWEEGEGKHELFLQQHDLFVVRRVRVRAEETGQ